MSEVIYRGRRIQILKDASGPNIFEADGYDLTLWDRRVGCDAGKARQTAEGSFEGYIVYGMHEISIGGNNLRALAQSAYLAIRYCDKH
jgi:hypothetical protein